MAAAPLNLSVYFRQEKKGTEEGLVPGSEKQRLCQKLPHVCLYCPGQICDTWTLLPARNLGNHFYNARPRESIYRFTDPFVPKMTVLKALMFIY